MESEYVTKADLKQIAEKLEKMRTEIIRVVLASALGIVLAVYALLHLF